MLSKHAVMACFTSWVCARPDDSGFLPAYHIHSCSNTLVTCGPVNEASCQSILSVPRTHRHMWTLTKSGVKPFTFLSGRLASPPESSWDGCSFPFLTFFFHIYMIHPVIEFEFFPRFRTSKIFARYAQNGCSHLRHKLSILICQFLCYGIYNYNDTR